MNEQPALFGEGIGVRSIGPALTGQQEMLRIMEADRVRRMHESVADWRVPELPQLDAFDHIIMDLETTGLRWWDTDRMVGAAVWTPDGQTRYFPVRHQGGENIPIGTFREWLHREVRNKRVVNIRTKFDLHNLREDGVDLEAQGCTFGDVAHYAALLDDHRRLFNQEDLALEFLAAQGIIPAEDCKVKTANGYTLDPTKFASYPPGLVAQRAESDVRIVAMLQEAMWPQLTAQGLHKVRVLEDGIIPVVVEMEHNGAALDVETLNRWVTEAKQDLDNAMWRISRATGVSMISPTNKADLRRLFGVLNLPLPIDPETMGEGGERTVSFADALLEPIKHPVITDLRCATALASLLSKFLLKYQRSVARDGILRYELHQLPYQDDEEGQGGAVSGRFSSAAPSKEEGANIQQVIGVKKQQGKKDPETGEYTGFTHKYVIKRLFKPRQPGAVWLKADASQFQFRLFAHYAQSPGLIEAYQRDNDWRAVLARAEEKMRQGLPLTKDDKLTDYHEAVQELILKMAQKELNRTHTKNVNFAQVFGAGIPKMASQIGVPADQIPDRAEWSEAVMNGTTHEVGGPKFQEVVQLSEIYHGMFPEVKPLLALTSHLAMPDHKRGDRKCGKACRAFYAQGYTHRGYVHTIDGRRARFGPHDRHYSGLNRIIQGSEGDINKRVLIEIHKRRHELGMLPLFTVHDEVDVELQDASRAPEVRELLNTQYYQLRVPILWELGTGPNWADAK